MNIGMLDKKRKEELIMIIKYISQQNKELIRINRNLQTKKTKRKNYYKIKQKKKKKRKLTLTIVEVLYLREIKYKTFSYICKKLNLTQKEARNLYHRGKEWLRR